MEETISRLLGEYESGRLSRRQFVAHLSAFAAMAAAGPAVSSAQPASTFEAVNYNHLALRVKDVQKSKEFYMNLLGMTPTRDSATSCFLSFGNHFLALFQGDESKMDHYCYSIENYDVKQAEEKLKALEIQPRITGNRIYFEDLDGLTVQLSAVDHRA